MVPDPGGSRVWRLCGQTGDFVSTERGLEPPSSGTSLPPGPWGRRAAHGGPGPPQLGSHPLPPSTNHFLAHPEAWRLQPDPNGTRASPPRSLGVRGALGLGASGEWQPRWSSHAGVASPPQGTCRQLSLAAPPARAPAAPSPTPRRHAITVMGGFRQTGWGGTEISPQPPTRLMCQG